MEKDILEQKQTEDLIKEELAFIKKYNGRKYTYEERSTYEKWSLDFFHNKEIITEPLLQITLQVDITKALKHYDIHYKPIKGASFAAYLMWHVVHTTKKHPYFRYRKIQDEWYIFDELPIYAPVGIGGDARFGNLILEPSSLHSLDGFFYHYRSALSKLFDDSTFEVLNPTIWKNAWFIGNLPNLQFTGYQLHTSVVSSGRPFFYFGKRYEQDGKLFNPLLVAFDHSNLDPFVLSAFMEDFQKSIDGE